MTNATEKEEWRTIYEELDKDTDEVFANAAITSVAEQRLSNHGEFDLDQARKNSDEVFALRNERRLKAGASKS
jgi:hypothetical protein